MQLHEYIDLLHGGTEDHAGSDAVKQSAVALARSLRGPLQLKAWTAPALAQVFARRSQVHDVLPEAMKSFVDEQVVKRGYGTSSEYVRELSRRDQQRLELRGLLLQGGLSAPAAGTDPAYFDGLREKVRNAVKKAARAGGR